MTKIHKLKRRFYYPVGLVSLIMLPTLCIWYLYSHKAFKKSRAIEVNWWSNDWEKYNTFPKRNYSVINITSNDRNDKIKLDSAQFEIRKLIISKDTTKGIRFVFENNSKYWTLIRAIDICKIEKANYFIPKDNDLWIINYVPKPIIKSDNSPMILCGTGSMRGVPYIESDEEIEENMIKKKQYILETAKAYSLSIAFFSIMILIAIKRLRNLSIT